MLKIIVTLRNIRSSNMFYMSFQKKKEMGAYSNLRKQCGVI